MRHPGCDYLFHVEGKPLNYCTIQTNYRWAQSRSGMFAAWDGYFSSKIDGEVQKEASLKILDHINRLGLNDTNQNVESNVYPLRRVK